MLRRLALLYAVVEILRSAYRFYGALELDVFASTAAWIAWPVNLLGLTAVLLYGLGRSFSHRSFWVTVLVLFAALRIYELIPHGLGLDGTSLPRDAIISARYAYLVLPSLLALWYLGFRYNAPRAL